MTDFVLDDVCIVACAEAWRGDGEILASAFGPVPTLGAKLAQRTFAPELVLDAFPYRKVFDLVWAGRRHVMMGASQLDRFGNQNISCIGDWTRPRTQLIGMRGAPGNTINHAASYWIPDHSPRVLVERVDVVCGVGNDRAAALGASAKFHRLRRVVTNLAVLDFETPDGALRLRSVHPGVTVEQVRRATGFELDIPPEVPETRAPTATELRLIRELRA
jgi:acyl CoA:acetate/3-ketoacid CoA transferase beta subunit